MVSVPAACAARLFLMTLIRINAGGAVDGVGTCVAPASLLIECEDAAKSVHDAVTIATRGALRVVHVGEPSRADALLREKSWSVSRVVDRPGCVLMPGLVNAHTHLDLTHIGPREFDPAQGFTGFIKVVLANRLTEEAAVVESIRRGVDLSLKGGVVAVGDIGGVIGGQPSLVPYRALRDSVLGGVSYLEFFGLGTNEDANLAALDAMMAAYLEERDLSGMTASSSAVALGLQPHAPYTASPRVFQHAAEIAREFGLQLCTHLAETPEEREFIRSATGPFRSFLERVGWWPPSQSVGSISDAAGKGLSAVGYLEKHLCGGHEADGATKYLLAHVNDASDADIALLASGKHSVVYSPRSSSYFRNHEHFGHHRYREMLKAGVNVCLGTDSVINLPSSERISTLDEMRFLYRRDGMDARELLAMATVRGARTLGLDESRFAFGDVREIAGIVAVPVAGEILNGRNALRAVLDGQTSPELLAISG